MRVYAAARAADLMQLRDDGCFVPSDVFAVTPALTAADPAASDEEWEYHVTYEAADASAGRDDPDPRRVVVVAEVGRALATQSADPARVVWDGAIVLDEVEAFLVDVVQPGGGIDLDDDLAWFATQELDQLI